MISRGLLRLADVRQSGTFRVLAKVFGSVGTRGVAPFPGSVGASRSGAKFKMTDVIGQYGLEDEFAADEPGLEQGYLAYCKVFGDLPPEAEDISGEQWRGVRALLASTRL